MNSMVPYRAIRLCVKHVPAISAAELEKLHDEIRTGVRWARDLRGSLEGVGINPFDPSVHPLHSIFGEKEAEELLRDMPLDEKVRLGLAPPENPKLLLYWKMVWGAFVLVLRQPHHSSQEPEIVFARE